MVKTKVVLSIHGMNDRKAGKNTVDKVALAMPVKYVDTDDAEYGYVEFTRIWFFKKRFLERVAGGIKKWIDNPEITDIYLLVHSNGLNFSLQALKLLNKRGQLSGDVKIHIIAYSGCANRKVNTDLAHVVYNWYTENDKALKAAKYLPSWTMGSFGLGKYRGKSKNVKDKRITDHISGHSKWFHGAALQKTIDKTAEVVLA